MNDLEIESLYLNYFSMGDGRKLADLAQNTGISVNTLYKLSAKHQWNIRVKVDSEALKQNLELQDTSNLSASERLSAISNESLIKVQTAIRKVPIKTVKDAQIMLNISQLTAARPTEITATANADSGDMISVSILFDIIESLPKEWADFAHAQLDRIIEDDLDTTPTQHYN